MEANKWIQEFGVLLNVCAILAFVSIVILVMFASDPPPSDLPKYKKECTPYEL